MSLIEALVPLIWQEELEEELSKAGGRSPIGAEDGAKLLY